MKILLSIALFTILGIGATRCDKKLRKFLRIVVCVGFSILIACSDNADTEPYKTLYFASTSLKTNTFELGYQAVAYFFNSLHFSYFAFIFTISFIALLLMESTISMFCKKPEVVYILYYFYPLIIDATQIRNFLCMAILVFSIRYIVLRKKYWVLKYYLGILIAVGFHNIAVLAGLVPLGMYACKRHFKWYVLFAAGLTIFAYTPIFATLLENISLLVLNKTYSYFANRARFGILLNIFPQMIMIYLTCLKSKRFNIDLSQKQVEANSKAILNDAQVRFNCLMAQYFGASIMFIPLYVIGTHIFFRAFRNLYILGYIAISNLNEIVDSRKKRQRNILLIIMLVFTMCMDVFIYMDTVVLPFLL